MWSDNESDVDLLRAVPIARAVVRLVTRKELLPTSIGVYGDWGSGKSTVLKMVLRDLKKNERVIPIWFNGWLFEGYQDARSALMGSILDSLKDRIRRDKGRFRKTAKKIEALAKRIDVIQAGGVVVRYGLPIALGLPHLTLATAAADTFKALKESGKNVELDELRKLIKDAPASADVRESVSAFRVEFAELLNELDVDAVVVIIDDLDRCLPPTIIETLEAIKLFLFVPQTAFVVGADERLIRHAVRLRFPELPGPEAEVGRDYLEKLIQIPVTIPQLSATEIESYLSLLFVQKHVDEATLGAVLEKIATERAAEVSRPTFDAALLQTVTGGVTIDPALSADLGLARQIALVLTPGLSGSPRRAKRFLNVVLLRLAMAEDRGLTLRRQVLAKLLVLEYIRPLHFRDLARVQAEDGRPVSLGIIERRSREMAPTSSPAEQGVAPTDSGEPTPGELDAWLADPWIRSWLASEPALADEDLRPYFHVARPRDLRLDSFGPALSPAAEDVLTGLLSEEEVAVKHATTSLLGLDGADASAVFDRLVLRMERSEKARAEALQKRLVEVATAVPALIPSLIQVFKTLPNVPLSIPMQLVQLPKSAADAALRSLISGWADQKTTSLARSAANALKRLPS